MTNFEKWKYNLKPEDLIIDISLNGQKKEYREIKPHY